MNNAPENPLQNQFESILARIEKSAISKGIEPTHITLTAVSKVQPDSKIDAMLQLGQRVYGENRVQEAESRWSKRKLLFPDLQLRLIGPLQTNKVEAALALFDVIETVDRLKLAQHLSIATKKLGKSPQLFVQINTGEEEQKAGVSPQEADDFLNEVRNQYGLNISGLMCIPPANEPAGPHFALLRKIAKRNGISKLSMGMSDDFETAIGFGATNVRIGSALFGERG